MIMYQKASTSSHSILLGHIVTPIKELTNWSLSSGLDTNGIFDTGPVSMAASYPIAFSSN